MKTKYGNIFFKHHKADSPPIILIHGLASSTRTWAKLVAYLPKEISVYMIDLLGHGRSDAPDIMYTANMQVEIIDELVKNEELKKPYLFGHSYGGWISVLYAKSRPTAGIILEDSGGLTEFYNEVKGTAEREEYKEDLLDKATMLGAKRHVVNAILDDAFREHEIDDEDLRMIKTPTLIIWGEEDRVIDVKYARIFSKGIKGSKIAIIKGARHTPHHTHPREVSELLLRFIKA